MFMFNVKSSDVVLLSILFIGLYIKWLVLMWWFQVNDAYVF